MELIAVKKLVIITETVIEEKIIKIIEEHGIKRYTLYRNIADKSEHGIRAGSGGLSIIEDDFKIEMIVPDEEKALAIMEKIAARPFFANYENIMYLEDVWVPKPPV